MGAQCPKCGDFLEEEDFLDMEYYDNYLQILKVGFCPTCAKEYKWSDRYSYVDSKILEEREPEAESYDE